VSYARRPALCDLVDGVLVQNPKGALESLAEMEVGFCPASLARSASDQGGAGA